MRLCNSTQQPPLNFDDEEDEDEVDEVAYDNDNDDIEFDNDFVDEDDEEVDEDEEDQENFDLKCAACEEIIQLAEKFITSDKSQGAVQKAISQACNEIPFVGQICSALANQFLSTVMADLANKLPPKAVCIKVRFCKA